MGPFDPDADPHLQADILALPQLIWSNYIFLKHFFSASNMSN